jgi:hypothetical protein
MTARSLVRVLLSWPRERLGQRGQARTDRLLLRPWRVAEAVIQRETWVERDPRVPPHRHIDEDGRATVADFEAAIRTNQPSSVGLLAIERKAAGDVIGYCGLIDSDQGTQQPELAFELLRRFWDRDTRPRRRGRCWTGPDRPGMRGCEPPSGIGTSLFVACWRSSDSPRRTARKVSTGPIWSPRDHSDCARSSA